MQSLVMLQENNQLTMEVTAAFAVKLETNGKPRGLMFTTLDKRSASGLEF